MNLNSIRSLMPRWVNPVYADQQDRKPLQEQLALFFATGNQVLEAQTKREMAEIISIGEGLLPDCQSWKILEFNSTKFRVNISKDTHGNLAVEVFRVYFHKDGAPDYQHRQGTINVLIPKGDIERLKTKARTDEPAPVRKENVQLLMEDFFDTPNREVRDIPVDKDFLPSIYRILGEATKLRQSEKTDLFVKFEGLYHPVTLCHTGDMIKVELVFQGLDTVGAYTCPIKVGVPIVQLANFVEKAKHELPELSPVLKDAPAQPCVVDPGRMLGDLNLAIRQIHKLKWSERGRLLVDQGGLKITFDEYRILKELKIPFAALTGVSIDISGISYFDKHRQLWIIPVIKNDYKASLGWYNMAVDDKLIGDDEPHRFLSIVNFSRNAMRPTTQEKQLLDQLKWTDTGYLQVYQKGRSVTLQQADQLVELDVPLGETTDLALRFEHEKRELTSSEIYRARSYRLISPEEEETIAIVDDVQIQAPVLFNVTPPRVRNKLLDGRVIDYSPSTLKTLIRKISVIDQMRSKDGQDETFEWQNTDKGYRLSEIQNTLLTVSAWEQLEKNSFPIEAIRSDIVRGHHGRHPTAGEKITVNEYKAHRAEKAARDVILAKWAKSSEITDNGLDMPSSKSS